jgi:ribosomal protein S6--L-glutamate ligase
MAQSSGGPAIGVVGLPEGWSSQRLADAVQTHTGHRHLIDLRRASLDLAAEQVIVNGLDLMTLDALIVKKLGRTYRPDLLDRLEVLRFLDERGVRVFSRPRAMIRVLDRLSCTVTLRAGGIPMPETVATEHLDTAVDVVGRFGKAVFKPMYTSKARGMLVIEYGPDVRDRVAEFQASGNPMLYIQRLVPIPEVDLGVAFLGGEYLATYARAGRELSEDPHTSTHTKYWPFEPSDEIVDLARRAQDLFDLDFTCVDVVETRDGPLVFEVSAFGGFRGLLAANNIDAADRYVRYVLKVLENGDRHQRPD